MEQYDNTTPLKDSILTAQDEKLKNAEQVLTELADGLKDDYIFTATEKEILECAADLVNRKRGVR